MQIIDTNIPDVKIVQPNIFRDERGYFMESYRASAFEALGIPTSFVQDNQSLSAKGILRGLHFQKPPHAQSKLVRVVQGAVLDVVVDVRKDSPYYGQHVAQRLDTQNMYQLFIPEGFAHGFLTLEEDTIFQYKCGAYYNKASEGTILWNDPALQIDWGIDHPTLSEKDEQSGLLADFYSPFVYPAS